MYFGLFFHL